MFLELDPQRIVETGERLRNRIRERFPDANLGRVADELVAAAKATAARSARIRQPSYLLRIGGVLAFAAALAIVALAARSVHPEVGDRWKLVELIEAVDSSVSTLVFLGAAFLFLWTIDVRRKRTRCLEALHEMRAMAHIIDMHQLTKDPDRLVRALPDTQSSPERLTDPASLARYLDYCSEMLSLVGKVAALYVQGFPDPVAVQAVDDIEDLTTSLSRKIWQKIMMIAPGDEPSAGTRAVGAQSAKPVG